MSTCVVGDIGGTNGRFAIFDGEAITQFKRFACADFSSFEQMLEQYLQMIDGDQPSAAAFVIATHVSEDRVNFTNQPWSFSISEIAQAYRFTYLKVINDFTSISIAIPLLSSAQLIQLGGEYQENLVAAKAVIGPGTGLGVSGLLPHKGDWVPVQGQGGHVSVRPDNDYERELFDVLVNDIAQSSCACDTPHRHGEDYYPYVSAENLLSGSGFLRLYTAVAKLANHTVKGYSPAEIVAAGLSQDDSDCVQVLKTFCCLLGSVAGDLALSLGARSGVYIGGGIASHIQPFLTQTSYFRDRFENKGCMTSYMKKIPAFIISEATVGLMGAVECRKPSYAALGVTCST